jgi:3-phosphoshikimate 1-carboxyvinyltransferase
MKKEINKVDKFQGTFIPPGDKSITHRAALISSIAYGKSVIHNYLRADDCLRTITAMQQMGINITEEYGKLIILGKGLYGLEKAEKEIDAGNSGTTMRLLAGIAAGQNFSTTITGDESLSQRPMDRIIKPLQMMGANVTGRDNKYPPITIHGKRPLSPIHWENKTRSAQVKSCILLAGLYANGTTEIIEEVPSRDHTERMLLHYGAEVIINNNTIKICPEKTKLEGREIHIPGDISSAAFFIAAATLIPNSELIVENVGLNPTRTGFIKVLQDMCDNAEAEKIVSLENKNNEPVGKLVIKYSKLKPINIGPEIIPQIIDELPLIALLATQAEGVTTISGAQELRVKESDRIKTTVENLSLLGAKIVEKPDGMVISGPTRLKGAEVNSYNDHRICMMLAIAGLIADGRTVIKDTACVNISFPEFWQWLEKFTT